MRQVVMRVIVTVSDHMTEEETLDKVEEALERSGFDGVYVESDIN